MREIESSLTKAKRRLVEVDADMLPVVQDHIRELQQTLASLECDVQAAETPSRQRDADCDRSIDLAMQQLASLRKTLEEGDAIKSARILPAGVSVHRGLERAQQIPRATTVPFETWSSAPP